MHKHQRLRPAILVSRILYYQASADGNHRVHALGMREGGGLGSLTRFSFLAKLSQIICCKQSTEQWSLVPSKGSVRWAVKAKSATLFFFMAEAVATASTSPQHPNRASALSIPLPRSLSRRRSCSIYLPTLSSWHTRPHAPHTFPIAAGQAASRLPSEASGLGFQ